MSRLARTSTGLDRSAAGVSPEVFRCLTNEFRIFPSPWHGLVHGLGLGQQPRGFDPETARLLVGLSETVRRTNRSPYHEFVHSLLETVLVVCADLAAGNETGRAGDVLFGHTVSRLPDDPWQRARACAILTECAVKLGRIERWRHVLRPGIEVALAKLEALSPSTIRDRYEQLQLIAAVFVASAHAGWSDLPASVRSGASCADRALRAAEATPDLFYRGRVSAVLFAALAVLGQGEAVCGGPHDYLRALLRAFDAELDSLAVRAPDGVHANADYSLFPLSLTLSAMASLGRADDTNYRRDWVQQGVAYFSTLSPRSQASQLLFHMIALANLGVLSRHVSELGSFFDNVMHRYLRATDRVADDDYLRCAYLVHTACYLGRTEVPAAVWGMLVASLARVKARPLASGYGAGYMVAAYTLSAFDIAHRLKLLFEKDIDLPAVIAACGGNAATVAGGLAKFDFALVNAALRLRPAMAGDSPRFRAVTFQADTPPRDF